jgi:hypothetical protein
MKKQSLWNTMPHYDHKSPQKLVYSCGSQASFFLSYDRLLEQLTVIQRFKKYLAGSNGFKCFVIVMAKEQTVPIIISTQSVLLCLCKSDFHTKTLYVFLAPTTHTLYAQSTVTSCILISQHHSVLWGVPLPLTLCIWRPFKL